MFSLNVHYWLAKSGLKRKQVYRFDHTASTEQLMYECIGSQFLRACLSGQRKNFIFLFIYLYKSLGFISK